MASRRTRSLTLVLAAVLALPLALSSCGGSDDGSGAQGNRAPVIDEVDAPTEVTATNGQYIVQVRVTYHDDDNETVSKVRLQIPAGRFDQTTPIQQATPSNRSAIVAIQLLAASAPPGTYDYSVSVVDERGLESAATTRQLTLK